MISMISIIIPTKNEALFLPRLLDSIKQQEYKDWEVIVADADSIDGTQEIAQRYGCKVVQGGNPAQGRNRGAAVAQGSFFLFIDADNQLPAGFLSHALKIVEEKKIDLAGFAFRLDEKGVMFWIAEGLWNWYFWITQRFYPHANNCMLVQKEMHEAIGGFNEQILVGEDFDYTRRAAAKGKFAYLLHPSCIASARRVKKEGVLRIFFVYLLAELVQILGFKITSPLFPYRFHRYEKKDSVS